MTDQSLNTVGATPTDLPPLPEGFALDVRPAALPVKETVKDTFSVPSLPDGFKLDQPSASPVGDFKGVVERGNIDLTKRPVVKNDDGTISTVRSMSFEENGKEILVPTVSDDGKILTNDEAINQYHKTGKHLGVFDNADDATAYAQALHDAQDAHYSAANPKPANNAPVEQQMEDFVKKQREKGNLGTTDSLDKNTVNFAKGLGENIVKLEGSAVRGMSLLPGNDPVDDFIYWLTGKEKPANYPTPERVNKATQEVAKQMENVDFGFDPGDTWEDVKKAPASKFIPWALKNGLLSAPDMAAMMVSFPGYAAVRAGSLAQQRAQNDQRENATVGDMLVALPASTASALLDRIGAKGMFGIDEAAVQSMKQLLKEGGKAATKEGTTEAAQQVIEDVATDAGTKKGFDPKRTAENALASFVGGSVFGGVTRGVEGATELNAHAKTGKVGASDLPPLPEGFTLDPTIQKTDRLPQEGKQGETVETSVLPGQAPVTRDGSEEKVSPPESLLPSISPEERAILRRTSIPDEDIDAMSRPEIEQKVAEARAANIKVNPAMINKAAQYSPPEAVTPSDAAQSPLTTEATPERPVAGNVPIPEARPVLSPEDEAALQDATKQSVAEDRQAQIDRAVNPEVQQELAKTVQDQLEQYRNQAADQALAYAEPDLSKAVQQSVLEDMKGDGTRQSPVVVQQPAHIDVAAQQVNTEPSDAQKEANNYKHGHIKISGIDITLENPKGSLRSGVSPKGERWQVEMPAHYGYAKGSVGRDGDQVDTYIGDNPQSKRVYVIDQKDLNTRRFDEHKAVLGVNSVTEARDLYARGFSDGMGADRIGGITPMSVSEFRKWLASGETTKPLAMGKPKVRTNAEGFPTDIKGNVKKPDSLIEFLARKGGVREDHGELSVLGLRDRKSGFVVGAGPLIRRNGMTVDKAREAAAEAGYLPMESSLKDFYDALDQDARSGRQVFSQYDDDHAARWREAQGGEARKAEEDASRSEAYDRLKADGFPVDEGADYVDRVAAHMANGQTYEDAVELAYQNIGAEQPEVADIPFFGEDVNETVAGTAPVDRAPSRAEGERDQRSSDSSPIEADRQTGPVRGEGGPEVSGSRGEQDGGRGDQQSTAQREKSQPQEPVAESRPVASWVIRDKNTGEAVLETFDKKKVDALNTDKYEAVPIQQHLASLNNPKQSPSKPAEEKGADNKPQLVIPGAERASDATMAQRGADAALKPKVAQKEPTGLFSDERNQGDLLDLAKKPEVTAEPAQAAEPESKTATPEEPKKLVPPPVVYHGTSTGGFDSFDTYQGKYGLFGSGGYFTEDPNIALEYTRKGRGEKPTVYSAKLNVKNALDMDAKADVAAWEKAFPDHFDPDNLPENATNEQAYREVEEMLSQDMIPDYEGAETMQDGVQSMGYDAITHIGGGRHKASKGTKHRVWIVFDPEQVTNFKEEERHYSANPPATDTPAFKKWFGDSKVVDAKGRPLVVYHGAKRSDRINESGKFDSKRATSGPMAFFTDSADIASSYATSKEDTSLDDEEHLAQRFQVTPKGTRKSRRIDQAWWALGPEERQAIASRAGRVTTDDDGNVILGPEGLKSGIGNYDYEIKQTKGDHLAALAESWLHSGHIFGEEEKFLDVLKAAGMRTPVAYTDPNAAFPGVFPVYLSIQTPMDTASVPQDVTAALEAKARRQRQPRYASGKDQWDKSVQSPRDWIGRLREDASSGTSHAWTSIPDWVTETLRAFGYDGIKDSGGKNGGDAHAVWIPFSETQVKSFANRGTFDPNDPRMLYSSAPAGWDAAGEMDAKPLLSKADQTKLVEIVRTTAGLDPEFVDSIKIPEGGAKGWGNLNSSTAAGAYSPMRDIVTLALDSGNRKVAYHESFHRLQNLFLTEKEHKVLKAEEPRLRKMIADNITYGPDVAAKMSRKEVEAEAFGMWADAKDRGTEGKLGLHIALRKVWNKIADMARRVRNYLNGRGFQTSEDVFSKARTGEIIKRAKRESKAAETQYAITDERGPVADPDAGAGTVTPGAAIGTRINDYLNSASKALASKIKSKGSRFDRSTAEDGETAAQLAHRKIVDYLSPVKQMQEKVGGNLNDLANAYQTARLAEGTIRHEIHQIDDKYITPAVDALAAVGASLEDLHKYMYAMHVPERNRVVGLRNEEGSQLYRAATDPSIVGASGMSVNQARDIIRDLQTDREKFMGIRRAASHIRAMLDNSLETQLRNGLINRETYDRLTSQWQNYVPLRAESDEDGVGGSFPSKSRGFDVRGDEFKGATGRFTPADNVVVYAINNAEQSVIRGEKNKAATAALRFINQFDPKGENIAQVYWSDQPEQLGDITKAPAVYRRVIGSDGKVTQRKVNDFQMRDDVLAAKVGGKTYYMKFADPKVGLALKKMTFSELGVALKLVKTVSNWQSLINTRANPAFIPLNLIRDVQTGATLALSKGFSTGEIAKTVGNIPNAWGALWRHARGKEGNGVWDTRLQDFMSAGGKISFDQYNSIEDTLKKLQKDVARRSSGSKPKEAWNAVVKLVTDLNDTIENGMRLAVFSASRARGDTSKQAAFLARDLTVDFQKKGEIAPSMNALYTFFNASVQGNYNFAKGLVRSRKVRAAMMGLIVAGYAQHLWNLAMAGNDDDGENAYKKMLRNEPWKFERQMVFFLPGRKDYITIPLGFGLNAFWHLGVQGGAVTSGVKGFLPAALDSTRVAFDAFNPLGSGGWVSMVLPSIIDPIWELGTNQDFTGRPIYPSENQFDPAPPPKSEQAFKSTAPAFKTTAKTLNSLTGGNDKEPGAVDVYPDSLEYLWGWFSGGLGRFVSQSGETAQRAVNLEFEPKKTPFIRSFYGETDDQTHRTEYYNEREKVQYAAGKMKEYEDAGDKKDTANFLASHKQDLDAAYAFEQAEKQRKKINKERRQLEKSKMPQDKIDNELDRLNDLELEIMDDARKEYFKAQQKAAAKDQLQQAQ